MNHTLAIARREIAEKRFALAAPAASALIILLLPLMPHVRPGQWREIYIVGSTVIAITFTAGIALILGASIVGRELSDRRLSFYFAKPVAAPAIWIGKLIASLLLLAATCAIASIPGMIAGRAAFTRTFSGPREIVVPVLVAVVILFFAAHVFSTIARSRSSWAFLDLAAFALAGFACWWLAQPLLSHGATDMTLLVGKVLGWLLLVAAIAAGAWQLSMGRTDRLQSHRALSQFLWPATAVAIAICAGIVAWVVAARPDDLTGDFQVRGASQSPYVFVSGKAAHRLDYHPAFLMNMQDGAFERVDEFMLRGAISPDGRKVLVAHSVDRSGKGQIVVRDLAMDGHEEQTDLVIDLRAWPIGMSADGSRLLYGSNETIAFYDFVQKKSLGSMRVPAGRLQGAWFVSPEVVRLYIVNPPNDSRAVAALRTLDIYEYDIRTRSYAKTGTFQKTDANLLFSANADGSRLFVRNSDGGVVMIDGRTGAGMMSFPDLRNIAMMQDGHLVGIGRTIRIMNAAGAVEREIAVDGELWTTRPIAADKFLITTRTRTKTWQVSLADVTSGAIVRSEQGLQPVYGDWSGDLRRVVANPNQLFVDEKGDLVRWNPLTNDKKLLIAAK
jgi:hypothetical protein